jgi:transcriptional regulator with XRE-family HTH domain
MQDPEYRAAYEALEVEYQMTRALIEARLKKRMTQREVAERAGLSQVMIARLESGTSNPTLATLNKVLGALGKKLTVTNV